MDDRAELISMLRGPRAEELLRLALGSTGLELHSWEFEQIYSRPGAEVSARFLTQCSKSGRPATLRMVLSTVHMTEKQRRRIGAVRADSAADTLHVWAHPADPELPGLMVVEGDPTGARGRPGTAELENRLSAQVGEQVQLRALELLVLRPLRRAVYRAVVVSTRGERTLYLKAVRPRKVPALLARHQTSPLIPTTIDIGDGILALDQAQGLPLAHHLYRPLAPQQGRVIDLQVVLGALDTLQPDAVTLPARPAPAQRLEGIASEAVAAGAPSSRVAALTDRLATALVPIPGPLVPTHGDFHPANVFLDHDARRSTALIDADTVGPGYRVDDLATLLAHLLALPSFDAQGYRDVPETLSRFFSQSEMDHDPVDLCARVAAVLISLIPSARDSQQLEHYLRWAEDLTGTASPEDLLRSARPESGG